ncbi:MAG TPA: Bcr/CflA family drug resistance efflux transporter, partial [Paenalcaligenes sp.]|nr:Bcr/CflA family drug resistance efflux transporter [Paenalcaligenes sp.]
TAGRAMEETLNSQHIIALRPRLIARNYYELSRHRRFMFYSLAAAFGSAGMFAYIAGSARVFISLFEVEPAHFGMLFGLNAASLIVASQFSARLLNRHAPDKLLRWAQNVQLLFIFSALALTLSHSLTLVSLMVCLMGFMACQGFISPNSAALALAEQGHRLGVASALMGTVQMLCGALAGFAVSSWQSSTPLPLTAVLAACAALSWLASRTAGVTRGIKLD